MPAKKKASKRQPQQRQNINWPVLDWTETEAYHRNLEETRKANLSEGHYERLLMAQAERQAMLERLRILADAPTSSRPTASQSSGTRGPLHPGTLPKVAGDEPRRRPQALPHKPGAAAEDDVL